MLLKLKKVSWDSFMQPFFTLSGHTYKAKTLNESDPTDLSDI